MKLSTPRVLVTGGASGIGAAVVRKFGQQGAQVAVCDKDTKHLQDLGHIKAEQHLLLNADITDSQGLAQAFEILDEKWGGLDILINNAGISDRTPFLTTTLDQWNRIIAVNLTGAFAVAQSAAIRMIAAGRGVIINMASVSGIVGMPGYVAYNVSKAGVISLTKTLALELAPTVRVNAVCPGYVLTPMQEREYTTRTLKERERLIPLMRLGNPEEIAAMVLYLASEDAEYITGQSFIIDGGETAGGLASR